MGLNTRLKRLEQAQTPRGEWRLYSPPAGDDLEGAEVVSVPTRERDGLARLADGTEKTVVWKGNGACIFDADRLTDKLWWIRNGRPVFSFAGSGLTEEDI